MKRILLTTVIMAFCLPMILAQVPQAFKYQAVVRDYDGLILADHSISLRISILYGDASGNAVYSEIHPVVTNSVGLVNLDIGRGNDPSGSLADINWAEGQYFIRIDMDENGGIDFKPMGVAQLLSVPYALHAGTASEVITPFAGAGDGNPSNVWILTGNVGTVPPEDKLGTTDNVDLMMVTNDIERLRIRNYGDVEISRNLTVGDGLTVANNASLNSTGGLTNIYGPLTVANLSPTLLSGNLTVDQGTDLNLSLNVDGVTDLNSGLNVNNNSPSVLSGTLLVNDDAVFNKHITLGNAALGSSSTTTGALVVAGGVGIGQNLNVGGNTSFSGAFSLSATIESASYQSGALTVAGGVGIAKRVNIHGAVKMDSTLGVNGQVTVHASPGTQSQDNYNDYPLKIEGSNQGIAIKVNGSRNSANNYVSFWDDQTGQMWGRIEGQTQGELWLDPEYGIDFACKTTDVILSGSDFILGGWELAQAICETTASATSSTVCAGLGACITAPIPSFICSSAVNIILKISSLIVKGIDLAKVITDQVSWTIFRNTQIGVTYQSGSGDYAEWLPKRNTAESFSPGELVGIRNGFVTKDLFGSSQVMVVSTSPIVLGNMPPEGQESNYVKIAFMGQVPVMVIGKVEPGDYILPVDFGGGIGRAVRPGSLRPEDYQNIVGVAWSVLNKVSGDISLVNIAVGINNNDFSELISSQAEQLNSLKTDYHRLQGQIDKSNQVLASLVPGYAEAIGIDQPASPSQAEPGQEHGTAGAGYTLAQSHGEDILYFEIPREQVETALEMAREQYQQMVADQEKLQSILFDEGTKATITSDGTDLMPVDKHPFWQKMDSDPVFKEEIITYVQESLAKAMHTHKKYADRFTDMKLHE